MSRSARSHYLLACVVIVAGFASLLGAAQLKPRRVSPLLERGESGPTDPGKEYLVGGGAVELFSGDFDGDGTKDLLAYSVNHDLRTLLHGEGGGEFTPWTGPELANFTYAVADFDGDGKDDLLSSYGRDNKLTFERSDGTGGFVASGSTGLPDDSYPYRPYTVIPCKLDHDERMDILVGYRYAMWAFVNNGDGTFELTWSRDDPFEESGFIFAGDFNEDGLTDMLSRTSWDRLTVLPGLGDGTFGDEIGTWVFGLDRLFKVMDFDGDGHLDVLVRSFDGNLVNAKVARGLGRGEFFFSTAPVDGLQGCRDLGTGNWNGDHRLDIACIDGTAGTVRVRLSGPKEVAERLVSVPTWITPHSVGAVDTGEGDALIFVLGMPSTAPLTNLTVFPPFDAVKEFGIKVQEGSYSADSVFMDAGDVDRDGDVDLVAFDDFRALLAKNDGSGAFPNPPAVVQTFPSTPTFAARLTDVNGDGNLDLVWTKAAFDVGLGFALGGGDGTFNPPTFYPFPDARLVAFDVADVDGDGRRDIAVGSGGGKAGLAILFGAPGDTHVRVDIPGSADSNAVVAADFDRDGVIDLASGFQFGGGVEVRLGLGGRKFGKPVPYLPLFSTWNLVAVDIDLDGDLDLVASSFPISGMPSLAILRGDGAGDFQADPAIPLVNGQQKLVVGDWTGDGFDDVALPNGIDGRTLAVIPSNASGAISFVSFHANGMPATADFNEDRRRDIMTVGERWYDRPAGALWTLIGSPPAPGADDDDRSPRFGAKDARKKKREQAQASKLLTNPAYRFSIANP